MTNPSWRLRGSSMPSPSSPKRKPKGTVGAYGGKAAPSAISERPTNEQLTDERSTGAWSGDEDSTDDQTDNELSPDERSIDEQPTNERLTGEHVNDNASHNGTKSQTLTDGIATNPPATSTSVSNIKIDDPPEIVPSNLAKFFAWTSVLLAVLFPVLRLPAFVPSALRLLKTSISRLELIGTLSPILGKIGGVFLGLRLAHALFYDFVALLIILRPAIRLLKPPYRYLLVLPKAMFRDFVTLLESLRPILRKSSTIYQRPVVGLELHRRVCKCMLVTCALLLSGTCTVKFALHKNPRFLSEVICPIPVVGLYLPPCQPTPCHPPLLQEIWSLTVISPQDQFATIMGRLGQDHNLSSELIKHHSALRDLGIRVKGSKLQHKHEIAEALESMKEQTRATGRSLHQFTTRFTSFVDVLHGFDRHALRLIEGRIKSDGRNGMGAFMSRILEALYPLTGFHAHRPIEEDIKEVFWITTSHMAKHITRLVDHAETLSHEIEVIQRFLETIKDNAEKDIKLLSARDILGVLWDRLAPGDKYGYLYVSTDTRKMLADLINLYEVASNVVRDIRGALLRVQVELQHCDTTRIQEGLLLQQYPLEAMAASLRSSMNGLDASRQVLGTGGGTRIVETIRPDKNAKKNTKP